MSTALINLAREHTAQLRRLAETDCTEAGAAITLTIAEQWEAAIAEAECPPGATVLQFHDEKGAAP